MKLNVIGSILYIQPGAPNPVILSNEYKLNLLYYYNKSIDNNPVEMPVERNKAEGRGVAILYFKNQLIYQSSYPNVEVLLSHRYYNLGLEPYSIFEVVESEWLQEIELMNKVHPFHNPIRYKMYKHYIVTFEDSTFECIASGLEINFIPSATMKQTIQSAARIYIEA